LLRRFAPRNDGEFFVSQDPGLRRDELLFVELGSRVRGNDEEESAACFPTGMTKR